MELPIFLGWINKPLVFSFINFLGLLCIFKFLTYQRNFVYENSVQIEKDTHTGFGMNYCENLINVFHGFHNQKEFARTGIGLTNVIKIVSKHGRKAWTEGEVETLAILF